MSVILLLDLDGIVIRPRHKYFSEKFSEEYNVPIATILPFFKEDYKKAATGKADVKSLLSPYMQKWGWEKSVDDFLDYWFEGERDLDEQILKTIKDLRGKGVKVYLVSDNESRRAKYLMDEVGLNKHFDGAFFSCDMGVTKSDPEFFRKVIEKLNTDPLEIVYWDDDPKNVDVAKGTGINAMLYTTFKNFNEIISRSKKGGE